MNRQPRTARPRTAGGKLGSARAKPGLGRYLFPEPLHAAARLRRGGPRERAGATAPGILLLFRQSGKGKKDNTGAGHGRPRPPLPPGHSRAARQGEVDAGTSSRQSPQRGGKAGEAAVPERGGSQRRRHARQVRLAGSDNTVPRKGFGPSALASGTGSAQGGAGRDSLPCQHHRSPRPPAPDCGRTQGAVRLRGLYLGGQRGGNPLCDAPTARSRAGRQASTIDCSSDPQTGVAPGRTRGRNVRSKCR